MNLLRTLLALNIENEKDKSVGITSTNLRSAQQLQPAKRLLASKSSPISYAYSSINLKNINKLSIRNNIDKTETSQQQDGDINIHIDLESTRNSPINLTLIHDSDLMKFKEMTLESEYQLLPTQCTSSIQSITSNTCFNIQQSMSDLACDPIYTISDLINIDTKIESEEEDEIQSIGDDIELPLFPLNEFKYMYQIGHGAFGFVDKSFHLKSCSIVAIKQCRSNNEFAEKCFKKEIKICNEFRDNKYIINMIKYGISDVICIALEYMNMSSLNKNRDIFCHNTVYRIKHISFCILNGLNALHNKLYVHNDIKPDNILFNDCGDVKISDFGCVKRMKDINTPLTTHCGTEFYQSFEKRFISPILYNTKSDIYSFGITICELLCMNSIKKNPSIPFKIPKEIMDKYRRSNPILIDFLDRCLKRNPKQRFNGKQLLKHPFLAEYNCHETSAEPMEDIDDLEFMINALIDYYSHCKHKQIPLNQTRIDNIWSDEERLKNIARFSGCTVNKVTDFISHRVKCVRDKYLKL